MELIVVVTEKLRLIRSTVKSTFIIIILFNHHLKLVIKLKQNVV